MAVSYQSPARIAPSHTHAVRAKRLGRWTPVFLVGDSLGQFASFEAVPVLALVEECLQTSRGEANVES